MGRYKVMVDDNFHYMDEEERYQHGVFPTAEQAIAACKKIVDDDLTSYIEPGMTEDALIAQYLLFGADPFIVPVNPDDAPIAFSAREYARERSRLLIAGGKP